MTTSRIVYRKSRSRAGFTLAEASLSTLLVGMLLLVSSRGVGVSIMAQSRTANESAGGMLADALIAEILQLPYADPNQSAVFGLESGEAGSNRSKYDDVDDYNGWLDSAPTYKDGTAMSVSGTWQRRVTVEWVTLSDLTLKSTTETGMKRVTVTVARGGKNVAVRTAVAANAP
jgi:hypothetical protein